MKKAKARDEDCPGWAGAPDLDRPLPFPYAAGSQAAAPFLTSSTVLSGHQMGSATSRLPVRLLLSVGTDSVGGAASGHAAALIFAKVSATKVRRFRSTPTRSTPSIFAVMLALWRRGVTIAFAVPTPAPARYKIAACSPTKQTTQAKGP